MQAIHFVLICWAALAGALLGAASYRWHVRQRLAQLQQRLLCSEEARNRAVARSAQAREQIAQLSKSIADLRKSHQPVRAPNLATPTTEARRARADSALAQPAAGDGKSDAERPSGNVILFANTQPMEQ